MFQLPLWLPILSIQLLTHTNRQIWAIHLTQFTLGAFLRVGYAGDIVAFFVYLVGYLEHAARAVVEAKGAAFADGTVYM